MKNRTILRREILSQRKDFNFKDFSKANDIIAQKSIALIDLLQMREKIIGIYHPIKGEIDLLNIFKTVFCHKLALPVVKNNNMYFSKFMLESKLVKSDFEGVYQPNSKIIIIPSITFFLDLHLAARDID